ncbi:MAG: NTP transferase domain-containing protein [Lacisediminihabitans sp.]
MLIDALVLAGGRSSRLDSVPKARLSYQDHTLLENTVAAVAGTRCTVVVGDVTAQVLPPGVLVTREEPPFTGPAAAIGAGLDRLRLAYPEASEITVVLACDMPRVQAAVPLLLREVHHLAPSRDGLLATDSAHRLQPLLAAYRTRALLAAVTHQRTAGALEGLAVFQLIRSLQLDEVVVPDDATADVDTWADAAGWGIQHPEISQAPISSLSSHSAKEQK